jgi:hypothetical protein
MAAARIIYPPNPRSGRVVLATIESTTSVFFAFVIGLFVLCACAMGVVLPANETSRTWTAPACVLPFAIGEVVSLWWLKAGLEGTTGRGRIPELALLQRPWPIPLRPLLAVWWLLHLGLAVGGMILLEKAVYAWWRKRFLIDMLVTAVALGVSLRNRF